MTSLIWGSIYLAHQGIMAHKHSKQRQKNYERWEDLRDEYDEQKKITRETRSLDLQRTGMWDPAQGGYYADGDTYAAKDERPILTLRDQQEANDARMSWRPQEAWEQPVQQSQYPPSMNPFQVSSARTSSVSSIPPHIQPQPTAIPAYLQPQPTAVSQIQSPSPLTVQQTGSTPSTYWQSRGEVRPQKTGATWDDELPAPLPVSRRSFEDYEYPHLRRESAPVQQHYSPVQAPISRTNSLRQSRTQSRTASNMPSRTGTPASMEPMVVSSTVEDLTSKVATFSIEPVISHVPGGRMAELIERGY